MRILLYNNCWFTNVGEAFIDIGITNIINKLWDSVSIACISDMSDYYAKSVLERNTRRFRKPYFANNSSKLYEYIEADYLVMGGMFASETYLDSPGRYMVDSLVDRGTKLVILGLGSEKYSEKERASLSKYYEKINPKLIVSRDIKTFEAYKDCANTISGIDCAFWVKDSFDPRGFANKEYSIHTFNRSDTPLELLNDEKDIIRPWHMQWDTQLCKLKDNYFMSDSPYDYLTLYANASKVHTDLVHATIPCLQYGTPVKYYYVDKRSSTFDSLEGVNVDDEGFLSVEERKLEEQKRNIIDMIKAKLV